MFREAQVQKWSGDNKIGDLTVTGKQSEHVYRSQTKVEEQNGRDSQGCLEAKGWVDLQVEHATEFAGKFEEHEGTISEAMRS